MLLFDVGVCGILYLQTYDTHNEMSACKIHQLTRQITLAEGKYKVSATHVT